VCNICDIINICSYYAMYDCSLKVEMSRLVGVGFMRRFVMRSLKMQLLLWCTLVDWLVIFCMRSIMCRRGVMPWNQDCSLSLSIPNIEHKISYIVRKGEKQIQILDGY
jgi:hypothetical protein